MAPKCTVSGKECTLNKQITEILVPIGKGATAKWSYISLVFFFVFLFAVNRKIQRFIHNRILL